MSITVFAFDRDDTVDVSDGPIPIEWLRWLVEETAHEVWAIGNQRLRKEADIPGLRELRARTDRDELLTRRMRLVWIRDLFPAADRYVVVDDIDLSDMEPEWDYYHPRDFYADPPPPLDRFAGE